MEIDIVIAWVDGLDPDWLREKARFVPTGDDSPARYRELGLLQYWFRSIEAFAPWARRIFFVTWGHVPPFLRRNHPKLTVVRHEEFIPKEYLPTFNSHTIELNLHRIPGISQNFVYFNDDMFLLRPTKITDFFRDGLPRICPREEPWVFRGQVGVWSHAAANSLGVINAHFSKERAVAVYGRKLRFGTPKQRLRTLLLQRLFPGAFTGFVNLHGPSPLTRDTYRTVWEAESKLLDATCRHRFRHPADVNQWVLLWWQIASGEFCPRQEDHLTLDLSQENIPKLCETIRRQSVTFLCINDPGGEVQISQVLEEFDGLFPKKSEFEL